MSDYNNTFNYTDTPEFVSGNYNRFLKSGKILFGNRERTQEFDENYFLLLQNYETYNSLYKNSSIKQLSNLNIILLDVFSIDENLKLQFIFSINNCKKKIRL